jgi:hypothetical protein
VSHFELVVFNILFIIKHGIPHFSWLRNDTLSIETLWLRGILY